ncbi:histidine kinase dimerization/phospho-acceptor domain-containing protein [Novosphingobium sp. JCM 18896]|uniref:histidine kinase dimerization/phospho-acceptor domain-containing protein n=1 Tax=Novosphingobium sp. JCM 18896 TaxID=2989731 RepID=UPI0022222DF0|nr:histidine kinase dimerization/phospho-acceptor domain-containing protein [Novosphingobium sp. JCM 18896]MCW1431795.1 hypothetical protein [Novosphingobium sp. JCM 18896]
MVNGESLSPNQILCGVLGMGVADYKVAKQGAEKQGFATEFHQMSQDLRNPLNSISGFAELLLLDEGLSPASAEYVRAILSGSQALTDAVLTYLDREEAREPTLAIAPACTAFGETKAASRRAMFKRARHWSVPHKLRSVER